MKEHACGREDHLSCSKYEEGYIAQSIRLGRTCGPALEEEVPSVNHRSEDPHNTVAQRRVLCFNNVF